MDCDGVNDDSRLYVRSISSGEKLARRRRQLLLYDDNVVYNNTAVCGISELVRTEQSEQT